jgi:hypothetical protein
MADVDQLHEAEGSDQRNYHWRIAFEITILFDEEALDWSFDELVVAAGPDSQHAIDRLKEHLSSEEEYGQRVTGVRIKDVRLLSVAEI